MWTLKNSLRSVDGRLCRWQQQCQLWQPPHHEAMAHGQYYKVFIWLANSEDVENESAYLTNIFRRAKGNRMCAFSNCVSKVEIWSGMSSKEVRHYWAIVYTWLIYFKSSIVIVVVRRPCYLFCSVDSSCCQVPLLSILTPLCHLAKKMIVAATPR